MPDEKLSEIQKCRKKIEAALPFWRSRWDAMTELEDFVNGDRYEDDHGAYNKDRRLVQIRGQEIQDTHRHVAAKVTERPRSVEARPRDSETDADDGEIAATLVEAELSDPWKDFDGKFEGAIISAREKRLGVVMMDWEPDQGPFGSILYRYVDPRRVMWDPCYEDPHDPMCPWFMEEKRIDVDVARKLYKKPWLVADKDGHNRPSHARTGRPIDRSDHTSRAFYEDDNKVTLRMVWYKNDKTYGKAEEEDYSELPDDQRYMVCEGCGYRSETQGELKKVGAIEEELPEMIEGLADDEMMRACPECGNTLTRIDAKATDAATLAYTNGHRMIVDAPYSPAPNEDEAVYNGDWPIPEARSFPVLIVTAYQKPGEPVGPCDTDLMWDQQVAVDQMKTMMVQRIAEHRNFWELPRDGIYNHSGRRFAFRDDDFNVMYRDNSKSFMSEVKLHQGIGLDPQFFSGLQVLENTLTQYRGVTDLGITQESSKNIAASTVAQLNQMGEIPTAHFKRRLNRALSKFYGVVWDYIRATYTPARLSRLNLDGMDIVTELAGDDLPNFDFVLSDSPEFTGVEKAKADAFNALQALMLEAPDMIEVFAEVNNLPRSVVKKVLKVLEERKLMGTAPPLGAPGADAGLMEADPELEEMAGLQQVPGYARGTRSQPGGTAIVGEDGPELVNLAPNTPVLPLGRMRDSLMQAAEYLGTFGGLVPKVGLKQVADMALGAPVEPMPREGSFADKLAWAASVPGVMPIGMTAFHGTPHKFPPTAKNPLGEFDLSKIGTGEGAQVYGRGTYLAENPKTAEYYQKALAAGIGDLDPRTLGYFRKHRTQEKALAAVKAEYADALSKAKDPGAALDVHAQYKPTVAQMESYSPGYKYEVDLPDEHVERMLDWDSPLSQQPQSVRAAVKKMWSEMRLPGDPMRLTGEGIAGSIEAASSRAGMSRAAAQDAAAMDLRAYGIPGIKYLDQFSRDSGGGRTRNFVVFDPSITKITGVE